MAEAPISLLFVDDEPIVLRAIEMQLRRSPYEVLTAAGAGEALQILDRRGVDVLIADVEMPDLSGIELTQIAARDYPDMLRILLTGHASLDRALQAINAGEVVRFFTKPLDPAVLMEELDRLSTRIRDIRARHREEAQARQRHQLEAWIDAHFPGARQVNRGPAGEVLLDLVELVSQVDDGAMPQAARDLLRKDA